VSADAVSASVIKQDVPGDISPVVDPHICSSDHPIHRERLRVDDIIEIMSYADGIVGVVGRWIKKKWSSFAVRSAVVSYDLPPVVHIVDAGDVRSRNRNSE
jgi:hypothetical protein